MPRPQPRPADAPNDGARRITELLRTMTLEQLARKLGCDTSTVQRWQRGTRYPDRRFRARLHTNLGIPFDAWEQPTEIAYEPDDPPTKPRPRGAGVRKRRLAKTGKKRQ